MKQNDAIAYKHWVENLQEPAPEGAWEAIADQLDIDAAWEGIAETLDLDDVWRHIDEKLPPAPAVSNPVNLGKILWLAAALILFTLTTPLSDEKTWHGQADKNSRSRETEVVSQSEAKPNNKPEVKAETWATEKPTESDAVAERVASLAQRNLRSINSTGFARTVDTVASIKSTVLSAPDSIAESREIHELSSSMTKTARMPQPDTLELVEEISDSDSIRVAAVHPEKDSAEYNPPGRATWQVGIIGSIKNTWLVNPETVNGLKRSSLNNTRLTFDTEFGLMVQRSVGGASAVQFEYYFYSGLGQRYYEYLNALYQQKDVKLRYEKFQVVYRTRLWRNLEVPAFYATGGIAISRLRLADTSIGNENQVVTNEYRPWDYGFVLGGEAEFALTDKLFLVSGLRASHGLRNIYLGTQQIPAEFNKTRTASVGVIFALRYQIRGKAEK